MRRVPPAEFNERTDQQSFHEIEIKGDVFQEYADNNFIVQTMNEVISAEPIASMNLMQSLSLAKAMGHGDLTGMSISKYALFGMLVSYARCFSSGVVRIKPEVFFSGKELEEHKFLIDMRSKYAAHDVNAWRDNHVSVRVSENSEEFLISPSVGDIILGPMHAKQISKLANIVKEKLEASIQDLDKKAETEIAQKTIEELRALPTRTSNRADLGKVKSRRNKSHK